MATLSMIGDQIDTTRTGAMLLLASLLMVALLLIAP